MLWLLLTLDICLLFALAVLHHNHELDFGAPELNEVHLDKTWLTK